MTSLTSLLAPSKNPANEALDHGTIRVDPLRRQPPLILATLPYLQPSSEIYYHTPALYANFIMPNISFDIFFQDDIINLTATRSAGSAPKVKPAWKVRTAPKLPPKEPVQPKTAVFGKPEQKQLTAPEPKVTPKSTPKAKETPAVNGETKKPAEAKKIPKLPPKAKPTPKA
ncbi:hypothetical protein MMC15_007506 [Xylographa vitiligo]|nr:hypothetical protein [Xylographa vitiligo]